MKKIVSLSIITLLITGGSTAWAGKSGHSGSVSSSSQTTRTTGAFMDGDRYAYKTGQKDKPRYQYRYRNTDNKQYRTRDQKRRTQR